MTPESVTDAETDGRTTARLKILVGLNRLWLAGAEINALDLAWVMRRRGHHVLVFAQNESDRAMVDLARQRGFDVRLLDHGRTRNIMRALESLVAVEGIDLIHTYYARLAMAAYLGPYRRWGTPLITTHYGMESPRGIPRYSHLIMGTEVSAAGIRSWYRSPVSVIEPPVDTAQDHPEAVDPTPFLVDHGLDDGRLRVAVVSRLDKAMKLEGIMRTIASVAALDEMSPTLVIVGSGDAEHEIRRAAEAANARLGRRAVVLTGRLGDPRPAYAAADVVVGMGSSVLRGMAFGKPVVVLGEGGFALPFEAGTAEYFFRNGFYGEGPLYDLTAAIARLLSDAELRAAAGAFGLQTVRRRYSLDVAGARLEDIYRNALHTRLTTPQWWAGAAFAGAYLKSGALRACEDARRLYKAEQRKVRDRGY